MTTTSEHALCLPCQSCNCSCGHMTTSWVRASTISRCLMLNDHFAEMSLNVDTIHATVHSDCSEDLRLARNTQRLAKEAAVIDGKQTDL